MDRHDESYKNLYKKLPNKIINVNKKEKKVYKNILSKGALALYVINLWNLSADLNSKFSNYRYILDVIDISQNLQNHIY